MDGFLAYMGGKSALAPFITSLFPPNDCYVEVFGGAAHVLFNKVPSHVEVYNDINNELVNTFWQIKTNLKELQRKAYWLPYSRTLFDSFAKSYEQETLTPVERATRFLYINKCAFSGQFLTKISSGPTHVPNWHTDFVIGLKRIRKRLDRVIIENLDFEKCITKYDRETTLFYLDPPYFAADETKYYKYVFRKIDHDRLLRCCKEMKGKFILSYEDIPKVRELYADFHIEETPKIPVASSNKSEKDVVNELLIMNYKLAVRQERLF